MSAVSGNARPPGISRADQLQLRSPWQTPDCFALTRREPIGPSEHECRDNKCEMNDDLPEDHLARVRWLMLVRDCAGWMWAPSPRKHFGLPIGQHVRWACRQNVSVPNGALFVRWLLLVCDYARVRFVQLHLVTHLLQARSERFDLLLLLRDGRLKILLLLSSNPLLLRHRCF